MPLHHTSIVWAQNGEGHILLLDLFEPVSVVGACLCWCHIQWLLLLYTWQVFQQAVKDLLSSHIMLGAFTNISLVVFLHFHEH